MANPPGTPIWYELLTTDVEGAKRFYGEIVGWTAAAHPSPDGGMPYTIFNVGETGVAGVAMPPEGAPTGPQWLAYFHVEDVDAKLAELERAGGKTHMPATDLPGVGRIALVADPQGVVFYLMKPAPPPGMEGESTSFSATLPGRCAWNELVTSDQKAALPFYGALLGWTSTEVMSMGPMGDYTFIDGGGERLGAMMDRAAPEQPLKWTFYFTIPDVDAVAERVKELGGQIIMGPMDVPGNQRIILALDPQGVSVGFVSGERQ
ncbi:VOC family protein [uncultured Sphingomonas sp.]|uniref:VOC family protein n=1 Tax=uncultured Sphingomonas sp. TaxID=158754 RepID=UPI0035C9A391